MKPLTHFLAFEAELLLLPFHGREAGPRFNYQSLKDALLEKLKDQKNYSIFGYSMGGYLALDLISEARIAPDSLTTYGTRFFWTDELVQRVSRNMHPATLATNLPAYVGQLELMHGRDWQNIISDTLALMAHTVKNPLTHNDFGKIKTQINLMVGDKDSLATPDETQLVSQLIVKSRFEILNNGEHDINKLDHEALKRCVQFAQQ